MQRARLARCLALLLAVTATSAAAAPCPPAVRSALDFWAGDWTVADTRTHERAGSNRVERVSKGYAFIERWTGAQGDEGTSLFYLDLRACTWRQTWVTDRPDVPGGLKHKDLVAISPDGSLRFQGTYPGRRFPFVLDRTTLTPRRDGTVRQVIEVSGDGGRTWHTGFDAVYTRR